MIFSPHYNALLPIRKLVCRNGRFLLVWGNGGVTFHLDISSVTLGRVVALKLSLCYGFEVYETRGSSMWVSISLLPVISK